MRYTYPTTCTVVVEVRGFFFDSMGFFFWTGWGFTMPKMRLEFFLPLDLLPLHLDRRFLGVSLEPKEREPPARVTLRELASAPPKARKWSVKK